MNRENLKAFAKETAKHIKTEKDLNDFRVSLKIAVLAILKRPCSPSKLGSYSKPAHF